MGWNMVSAVAMQGYIGIPPNNGGSNGKEIENDMETWVVLGL